MKQLFNTLPVESVWTTSVSVFEVCFGITVLNQGKRKAFLERAYQLVFADILSGRVLDFDTSAAVAAADLLARLRRDGRPMEIRDLQIAGVVSAKRATLATRNIGHFQHAGIDLVNPWDDQVQG